MGLQVDQTWYACPPHGVGAMVVQSSWAVAILFVLASHAAALSWDGVYYVRARLEHSFIHAPSSCVAHPVWCVHNIFVSQDPDELKITLSHSGTTLNAHTQDWEISGTITSSTHASLAGLEGTLTSRAVTWSNGVVWSREQVATPVAPPTWPGTYHAARAGITIKIMQPSDTKVIAEGTRYAVSTNAFILFACTHTSIPLTRFLFISSPRTAKARRPSPSTAGSAATRSRCLTSKGASAMATARPRQSSIGPMASSGPAA